MKKVLLGARREVKKNILVAVSAAFAFLIALVWRDAISDSVNKLMAVLALENSGYIYSLATALIVTLICVLGILIVNRQLKK